MADQPLRRTEDLANDTPPVLGSWRNLYLLLVAELASLVLLFYALTRWAS